MNALRAIAIFAKAVELGSIRRAASTLDISPQAASQTIAQLERHLGVRLLHRTTRSLALTDEGQRLLESTQPALLALDRALLGVRENRDQMAGPLRIVGPRSTFAPVLMPLLDEFCRCHPEIQPDVQLDDGIGNWVQDRVDVGFRIGSPPGAGLVVRRLFPLQLIVCAAPLYLERFGAPGSIEELDRHRCSVFRHPATSQILPWYLQVNGEVVERQLPPSLSTNDADLELQAVLAGQVIGQLSALSAAHHLRKGDLVPLLLPHVTDHMSVHLYFGSRKTLSRRVRAFIDLAVERLADNAAYWLSAQELAAMRPHANSDRLGP